MLVVSARFHYFLVSPNIIWLSWQRRLTNWKIRYSLINRLHPKRFHTVLYSLNCCKQYKSSCNIGEETQRTASVNYLSESGLQSVGLYRPLFRRPLQQIYTGVNGHLQLNITQLHTVSRTAFIHSFTAQSRHLQYHYALLGVDSRQGTVLV